jgi:hypothetical protein
MNYTELDLKPDSNYSASVTVDKTTEVAQMSGWHRGGIVISWNITFSTDGRGKISEIIDPYMGDIIRIEEYDFHKDSIKLL